MSSQPRDGDEEEEPSRPRPNAQDSFWDGTGTDNESTFRPWPDKGKYPESDGGTDGTDQVRESADELPECIGCGTVLYAPDSRERGTCHRCHRSTPPTTQETETA